MLGLEHAPHRTALYRTGKRLSEEYMGKLNRRILERLKPAMKVGADATGMRQSKRDCAWSSASLDGGREYTKIQGLFNLETGTVQAFDATKGTEHECKHLPDLLTPINDIECFVADPGYLSRRNCWLVAEKGGTPYIKPKKNSLMKTKGCWIWKNMVTLFREHSHIFNRFYKLHQRVEAGWLSLKSTVGDIIRNRNKTNHKKGSLVKNNLLQPHLDNQRKLRILAKAENRKLWAQVIKSTCTCTILYQSLIIIYGQISNLYIID
jgi:hypothetical protein